MNPFILFFLGVLAGATAIAAFLVVAAPRIARIAWTNAFNEAQRIVSDSNDLPVIGRQVLFKRLEKRRDTGLSMFATDKPRLPRIEERA